MSRIASRWSIVAIAVAASGIAAGAKTIDAPRMTCEDFLALEGGTQSRAVVWLDGYSTGSVRSRLGEVDVARQLLALVTLCAESPQQGFWDTVRAQLPSGQTKLEPLRMTCKEFVDLDPAVQSEAVYWLHGYKSATIAAETPSTQVDLERDIGGVVAECERAPTESLWSTIRKRF